MEAHLDGVSGEFAPALAEVSALRQFPGAPREFWTRLLAAAGQLASADIAAVLIGQPDKTPRWGKLGEWNAGGGPSRSRTQFHAQLEAAAERGLREGGFVEQTDATAGSFTVAVRLKLSRPDDEVVFVAQLLDFTEAAARESQLRLNLVSDTPALYQLHLAGRQAAGDVEKFASVLDLLVPVNEATRFLSAALALVNGAATRFRCERASLGWIEGGYLRLHAMSRTEQFDRRMAAAQALEAAMEECLDQDEEILARPRGRRRRGARS